MTDDRIHALDAVRGLAVLGIFAMNVVAMGLPSYAYIDPFYAGLHAPVDSVAWAVNYVFVDGKMRALFTMLFGVSMAIITARVAGGTLAEANVHYRRMFFLLLFGMVHAWFFFFGDILFQYAIAGALAFPMRRWPVRALAAVALAMGALHVGLNIGHHLALAGPDGAALVAAESFDAAAAAREIALYRGGFWDAFAARVPMTLFFQTYLDWINLPEVLAFMAFGLLLYRIGFFHGRWSTRRYALAAALGLLVAAPASALVAGAVWRARFDPVLLPLTDSLGFLLRPSIALAYASLVMLLLRAGRPLARLAAAGRMAFSNYLGTTLVATTLFYGYGFGLYAHLSRAELWLVVLGVWALILGWSAPWLARYRYGPFEWAWRSLVEGRAVAMRRAR